MPKQRKYNPEKSTAAIKAAAQMPPLPHSQPDGSFDVQKSEVINWLTQQPEIRKACFSYYHDAGAIVFDQESKTWRGVETR